MGWLDGDKVPLTAGGENDFSSTSKRGLVHEAPQKMSQIKVFLNPLKSFVKLCANSRYNRRGVS
jgi:hypothetical protein